MKMRPDARMFESEDPALEGSDVDDKDAPRDNRPPVVSTTTSKELTADIYAA
jgi:hypothetical protein